MPDREPSPRALRLAALVPALFALGQAAYLWALNERNLGRGLPIDDAYIFLRYAGNLAAGYGFSFNPGEVSFGCTSLLWPVLVAGLIKAVPSADPVALSFWLGASLYVITTALAAGLVGGVTRRAWAAVAAGAIVSASPYLLMNAVSGMETPLTLLLIVFLAGILTLNKKPRALAAGIIAGLLTVNRPESLYFGPVAAALWVALSYWRRLPQWKPALVLLAGWAVIALPAGLYIYFHTGSFLPTTYLGKIIAGSPDALHRGLLIRLLLAAGSLRDGWLSLGLPLMPLTPLLAAGVIYQTWSSLRAARRFDAPLWPAFGFLLLAGYLFLPAVYGFSFPVHPPFGGYYVRYIAPAQAVFILVGTTGLAGIAGWWAARQTAREERSEFPSSVEILRLTRSSRRKNDAFAAAILIMTVQSWMWAVQFPPAVDIFAGEVGLNSGLRKQAGLWLRAHVPKDDRVMVGYTGLGVVGYYSERYCLDLGALINPDIFPYYKASGVDPARRREAIIRYMTDRRAGWYVTFPLPAGQAGLLADPTTDPRFTEATRLGAPGEPKSPYRQIRVYRFDEEGKR